jgi:hypothetical protein
MESVNKQAKDEYYHISLRRCAQHKISRFSWSSPPGGGTTDYAVDIFHKALADKNTSFLSSETKMPMMYMDDAIAATIKLCKHQLKKSKFIPPIIYEFYTNGDCCRNHKHIPEFTITYEPDFRQKIADSWPASIDDSSARADWDGNTNLI